MRSYEFIKISEDISRRGFVSGVGAAAGLGTIGYGISQKNSTQNQSPKSNTASGVVQQAPSQQYSPQQLKEIIIKYAKKYLPEDQVIPFIAQLAHESHDFRSMEENLKYSARVLAKRYSDLFPIHYAQKVEAHPNREQIIANKIYANRMGNGDVASGDGYRYRGRGYIQLTGRENYRKIGKAIGVDLENNPDLAAEPKYAAPIAIHYWKTRVANKVNTSNLGQVTKKISGSANQGKKSRMEKLKRYTKELGKK
jgi:putative chitinase